MSENKRPWSQRAEQLRAGHGDGCDLEAWREWLIEKLADDIDTIQYGRMLLAHGRGEVALYSICCGLADREAQ